MPDRNGKIFYTSITSLSHISKLASYETQKGFVHYYYTDELEEYQKTELCHYDWTEPGANAPCRAETCKTFPYDYHTYVLNFDGSMYNEICEFTFDDEKTGHGYYYQANRDAE